VKIHVGFDLTYESAHPTPMIFMLNVHPSRAHDLITPDRLRITPSRAISPSLALARRGDQVATEIRNEVARWTTEILNQPIEAFKTVKDALEHLTHTVEARIRSLQVRETERRAVLSEVAFYVDDLQAGARYEQIRKGSDERLSF
jgi:hypothetical protein